MSSIATATPLIVETSRGPCIARRRTTVYVILAHLNNGCDREFIRILLDHDIEGYVVFLEVVLYLDNSSQVCSAITCGPNCAPHVSQLANLAERKS